MDVNNEIRYPLWLKLIWVILVAFLIVVFYLFWIWGISVVHSPF